MMDNTKKEIDFCVSIDDSLVLEIKPKITQEEIITTVKQLRQKLIELDIDRELIYDVYDICVEMLQNILKYSYGTKIYEGNIREADGIFKIIYNKNSKNFIITSTNLIQKEQIEIIKKRIEEINGLDNKQLRKLIRTKIKSKRDTHKDGAGLGFATIATRISEPIEISFEQVLDNIFKYSITVVVFYKES